MGNDYVPGAEGFAAGAIVHRLIKEVRRINVELDRVKMGRAIDPVSQDRVSQKAALAKAG